MEAPRLTYAEAFARGAAIIALIGLTLFFVYGCAPRPYVICDGTRCTKPLTHEETVRAHEVKKVWADDAPLEVEVAP